MMDPEIGRCRRTDGRKWRCKRNVVLDQKYCERHMHRGRAQYRSRKPVENTEIAGKSPHQSCVGKAEKDSAENPNTSLSISGPGSPTIKIPTSNCKIICDNSTAMTVASPTIAIGNCNKRKKMGGEDGECKEEDGISIELSCYKGDDDTVGSQVSAQLGFHSGEVLQAGT